LRPKSTKTTQLSAQQNKDRIDNLKKAQSHKEENLFKLKKFQTSKPRIDTINRNYVPASKIWLFYLYIKFFQKTDKDHKLHLLAQALQVKSYNKYIDRIN